VSWARRALPVSRPPSPEGAVWLHPQAQLGWCQRPVSEQQLCAASFYAICIPGVLSVLLFSRSLLLVCVFCVSFLSCLSLIQGAVGSQHLCAVPHRVPLCRASGLACRRSFCHQCVCCVLVPPLCASPSRVALPPSCAASFHVVPSCLVCYRACCSGCPDCHAACPRRRGCDGHDERADTCTEGANAAQIHTPHALTSCCAVIGAKGRGYPDQKKPPSFIPRAHFIPFYTRSGLVPIQTTGAPAQNRAADRPSDTPAVLPSRYVASVDHTGLLRCSPRCSMTTQRARMQQRPSSETASVSACAASCFVARVRTSREEKTASTTPAESHVAVYMPAARKEAI
jgi:hypothetical protein